MRKPVNLTVKTFVEKHIDLLDTNNLKELLRVADNELSAWDFEGLIHLLDSVECFTRELRADMFWEWAYDQIKGLGLVHIKDVPLFLKYVPSYGISSQDRVEILAKRCKEVGVTF